MTPASPLSKTALDAIQAEQARSFRQIEVLTHERDLYREFYEEARLPPGSFCLDPKCDMCKLDRELRIMRKERWWIGR